MRQQIAHEGAEFVKGQIIEHNALTWGDEDGEKFDVRYTEQSEEKSGEVSYDQLIGYATDLRRENDGIITADIQWLSEYTYKNTTVHCTQADMEYVDDILVVRSAAIHHIMIGIGLPWGDPEVERPE